MWILITYGMVQERCTLQWSHNERDGISNHLSHDCLLNRLFTRRSKKTSKFHVTGLCEGNSEVTGEFPAQRASNEENVAILWHHGSSIVEDLHLFCTNLLIWGYIPCSMKPLGSTLIRHRSDIFVSDRCLIDVDPRGFVIWMCYTWHGLFITSHRMLYKT